MIVKVMEHGTGGFRLIETRDASFRRLPGGAPALVLQPDEPEFTRTVPISSRAFILTPEGETLESFPTGTQGRQARS